MKFYSILGGNEFDLAEGSTLDFKHNCTGAAGELVLLGLTPRNERIEFEYRTKHLFEVKQNNENLEEQVLNAPGEAKQRIYELLYNSGCRINR